MYQKLRTPPLFLFSPCAHHPIDYALVGPAGVAVAVPVNASEPVHLHGTTIPASTNARRAVGWTRHESASRATRSATKTMVAQARCQASAAAAAMCCGKASAAAVVLQTSLLRLLRLQMGQQKNLLQENASNATCSAAVRGAKGRHPLFRTAKTCALPSS